MAVAFVQAARGGEQSSSTAIEVFLAGATTTGNMIVGSVTYEGASDLISSINDDGFNTYVKHRTLTDGANSQAMTTFSALNITGAGSNGTEVIFSSARTWRGLSIHEVSGVALASAHDGGTGQVHTPTTATDNCTSTAVTTTANGDYIFGATMDSGANAATHTAGTSYTRRTNGNSSELNMATEDRIQAAAGSIAATWTSDLSVVHMNAIETFKAAVAVRRWILSR